jgi:DNA polymerase
MYEFMADKINGFPAGTVTKETHPAERQDGKTGELAFGYQGALGAWLKFDKSGRHSDARIIEICKAWRAEHSASVNLWYGLENAAIEAVRTRRLVEYREIGFEIVDEWLTMILPNGKRIWYYNPQIRATRPQWCKPEVQPECAMGVCGHDPVPSLCYMAQKEGQWKLVHTYGGKLTENACQAISREILVPAMMRAEAEGYHVILSVYDEIITEVPEGFGSTEEFEQLMAGPLPDWAHDWPVSVKGWEGARYKK